MSELLCPGDDTLLVDAAVVLGRTVRCPLCKRKWTWNINEWVELIPSRGMYRDISG
jgi:hypothetical protein